MAISLTALLARCEPLDLSPQFTAELAKLAEYQSMSPEQKAAVRVDIESFADSMQVRLHAERTKVPTDDRACRKLEFLAYYSRALVFAR